MKSLTRVPKEALLLGSLFILLYGMIALCFVVLHS